jgi:hypothetical protein
VAGGHPGHDPVPADRERGAAVMSFIREFDDVVAITIFFRFSYACLTLPLCYSASFYVTEFVSVYPIGLPMDFSSYTR